MAKKKAAPKTCKKPAPERKRKASDANKPRMAITCRDINSTGVVVGQRFGKLLITAITLNKKHKQYMATCLCDCGKIHTSRIPRLVKGQAIECTSCAQAARWALKKAESRTDHFSKLGSMGGKRTLKNNGPMYFRRIAFLAHQKRRENAAARELEKDALASR